MTPHTTHGPHSRPCILAAWLRKRRPPILLPTSNPQPAVTASLEKELVK